MAIESMASESFFTLNRTILELKVKEADYREALIFLLLTAPYWN